MQHIFLLEGTHDNDNDATGDGTLEDREPHISLHTIVGVRAGETMQVCIQLSGTTLLALLKSGSMHNFISKDAMRGTSLQLEHHRNMKVTVANDVRIPCLGVFRGTPFSIHGEADHFALPLARYDIMLGHIGLHRWAQS